MQEKNFACGEFRKASKIVDRGKKVAPGNWHLFLWLIPLGFPALFPEKAPSLFFLKASSSAWGMENILSALGNPRAQEAGVGLKKIDDYVNTFMGFTFAPVGGNLFTFSPEFSGTVDTPSGFNGFFSKFLPFFVPLATV